ncbi:FHA domain-containing protein [Streptomyces sp. 7R007]
MQIRLTVVDPLGPSDRAPGRTASRDVLVTAPAGTALGAVASALASAVSGEAAASGGPVVLYAGAERLDERRCTLGEPPLIDGAVLSLGAPAAPEPHPELDDAPTQLHVVAGPDAGGVHLLHGGEIRIGRSADADVPLDDPDVSRLHCAVTVAPDGRVSVADLGSTNGTTLDGTRLTTRAVRFPPGALLRIGESALRLAPAGGPGARVRTVADGEGCVRVAAGGNPGAGAAGDIPGDDRTASASRRPEGRAPSEGGLPGPAGVPHARVADGDDPYAASRGGGPAQGGHVSAEPPVVPGQGGAPRIESSATGGPSATTGDTHGGRFGALGRPSADVPSRAPSPDLADDATAHGPATDDAPTGTRARGGDGTGAEGEHAGRGDARLRHTAEPGSGDGSRSRAARIDAGGGREGARLRGPVDTESGGGRRKGTPLRGTDVPQGLRRRGGLTAWARRLAGGRGEQVTAGSEAYDEQDVPGGTAAPSVFGAPQAPETWPDPAALLLTALGPGPRLWERGPGHPEALTVRLGTADRTAPDGSGLLPAVPVTADLREVGALGLAGPRARLSGLARAVVAQLAALHSPELLEIVLISADRSRSLEERTAEWSWLGWLPHLRPAHGQDCRLLLAHDREQATARTDELLRRLEDQLTDPRAATRTPLRTARPGAIPAGTAAGSRPTDAHGRQATADAFHGTDPHTSRGIPAPEAASGTGTYTSADGTTRAGSGMPPSVRGAVRRPSWARDDDGGDETGVFAGPYTVLVVDGDPGGADVREAVARLAAEGPVAGIHVVCLAETPSASPVSPVTQTYEAACAVAPVFRECGAVALLSGDVATALRLMRVARTGPGTTPPDAAAPSGPISPGTVAAVDAVSLAWAERFARALAPLRPDGSSAERHPRVSVPLPQAARLLDELGLARATPASLMARWADAADDTESLGGRAWAVLGAGPRGPVCADLAADGPHLLIEGPAGSGRTELLRAVVASLAAAERPDRLGIVLIDGRDSVGTAAGHGDGLRPCTDVPHVTTHLTANDPVRMREFAQSLTAELKRRAELLGRADFTEWHTSRETNGRLVAQRPAQRASTTPRGISRAAAAAGTAGASGATGPSGTAAPARATGPSRAPGAPGSPGSSASPGTHAALGTSTGLDASAGLGRGTAGVPATPGAADLDAPSSATLRLRPAAARRQAEAPAPLPRLVVVVDDLDALVSPALGSPGRPAAGSVMRALEAVAREGERLGVHLVAAAGPGGRTAETEPSRRAALRVTLDAPGTAPEDPAPGRGRLTWADGRTTAFQGGRVTGRIPRTSTLRPTVVPLEWHRMGDPPARRPVRELGNGPTDLALLASALERAAREVAATEVPSLL